MRSRAEWIAIMLLYAGMAIAMIGWWYVYLRSGS